MAVLSRTRLATRAAVTSHPAAPSRPAGASLGALRERPRSAGAALLGHVVHAAADARIRVSSAAHRVEFSLCNGEWACFGLPAGRYRVEYVSRRMILARDVELVDGDERRVDFRLVRH